MGVEMPQCCADACIKAHDRASGVWSGYGLGSLGYGLGTRNAGRKSAQVLPPSTIHIWHICYGLGADGNIHGLCYNWVRFLVRVEYAGLLVALLATFTGTFASGYHSGRSSAQSPSSSTSVFVSTASEPSDQQSSK